jgi:hypothetical protein
MAGMEEMLKGMNMGGGEGGEGGEPDMASLMQMLGKGGGKGMGGMGGGGMGGKGGPDPDAEHEEDGGKWKWNQKGSDEVQVTVPLPEGITKKDVAVVFKAKSLKVSVKGEVIIDGDLSAAVDTDECTWCFSPDKTELNVMMTKQQEGNWPKLLGAKRMT